VRWVEPGTFSEEERLEIQRRRGRGEQYKHQYLVTEVVSEKREAE
jgi:hypothetical protein